MSSDYYNSGELIIDHDATRMKIHTGCGEVSIELKHLEDSQWTYMDIPDEDVVEIVKHLVNYLGSK